jgi:hypothetical protein
MRAGVSPVSRVRQRAVVDRCRCGALSITGHREVTRSAEPRRCGRLQPERRHRRRRSPRTGSSPSMPTSEQLPRSPPRWWCRSRSPLGLRETSPPTTRAVSPVVPRSPRPLPSRQPRPLMGDERTRLPARTSIAVGKRWLGPRPLTPTASVPVLDKHPRSNGSRSDRARDRESSTRGSRSSA